MNEFYLKSDDLLPTIRANLQDENGYVDVTAGTVRFVFQDRQRNNQPITGSATILGGSSGYVEYVWTGNSEGVFYGEFVATLASSKQITFPNSSYILFQVLPRLK